MAILSIRSLFACLLLEYLAKYAVGAKESALESDGFNGLQGAVKLEADAGTVSNVNCDIRLSRSGAPAGEQCERVTEFDMTMHASLAPDTEPGHLR